MIYFTSDTHFGHTNIIKYCDRPFANVDEMNRVMTERWNSVVKPEDTVFHLGDVAMGPKHLIPSYMAGLNGKVILIAGNHDRVTEFLKLSIEVHEEYRMPIGNDSYIYMHHEPYYMAEPDPMMLFFLCGHIHQQYRRRTYGNGQKIINVGVDVWDFTPRTLYQLMEGDNEGTTENWV